MSVLSYHFCVSISLDYPRQFNYQTIFIYFLFIWFDILNSLDQGG